MNSDAIEPRLQPHNEEAECALLGGVLLDESRLAEVRAIIEPGDFYSSKRAAIFMAMLTLTARGEPLDNVTLSAELDSCGELQIVGGSAAIAELLQVTASPANVAAHARLVREHAERRRIIHLAAKLSDAAYRGASLDDIEELMKIVWNSHSLSCSKSRTLHEREFSPLVAGDFLDQGQERGFVEWVLEDYLPRGGVGLLVAKPKEGKSTIGYELAVKVAKGEPFLGRSTGQGGVLILALEEHPRDVRLRLRALQADGLSNLFIFTGQLTPHADTFERIRRFALDHQIVLIVVDTLGAFWNIRDENDAAEVQKAMKPIQALARGTEACALLIHHARKSEGSYGDEIRGSGALFAAVDVALIMKRHEIQTQRLLQAQSRYPETPAQMVLNLTEAGYVALGDPAAFTKQARHDKLKAALSETLESQQVLAKRAGIPSRDVFRILGELVENGEAVREGKGRKGSPFLYGKNTIHATPPVLGGFPHETNSRQMEFDSCAPHPLA